MPCRPDYSLQQDNNGNNLGLRAGDWKLVRLKQRGKSQAVVTTQPGQLPAGEFSLYDLTQDPGETHDVSADHPTEFERLQEIMRRIVADGRTREL